jgi:hypothetical protein
MGSRKLNNSDEANEEPHRQDCLTAVEQLTRDVI